MKILLVGDYSGIHATMRNELIKRGHKVTLVAGGDGFKAYHSDMSLTKKAKTLFGKKMEAWVLKYKLNKMKRYDIVQFINPDPIHNYYSASEIFELVDSAKLSVAILCGCDSAFYKNYVKINPHICGKCEEIDEGGKLCHRKINRSYLRYEEEFYKKIDMMIPLDWCYFEMHTDANEREKMCELLPMPIEIGEEPEIGISEKLRVLHPLNRKGFKGTPVIREAFIRLERKYKDRAEFIIDGHMPYKQYVELSRSVDIILDQTYSSSAGMSALLAMEQGKIVMGGLMHKAIVNVDKERHRELPMFTLGDTVEDVVENVSKVLDMGNEDLLQRKRESREYIKRYHDVRKVVDQLLEDYQKGLEKKGGIGTLCK